MRDSDKKGWSSVHKGKSSLDKTLGQRTQLILRESESSCPSQLHSHRKIQGIQKHSGFALASILPQKTLQKPTSARMQPSIHTIAMLPDLYRDLDHHTLTVRPLEAISGNVRVAGVVSRFRALESCNITASISYKIMYRTTAECDSWAALDSVLQNPTAFFCKC